MNMVEDGRKQGLATFAGGCFWCMESDFHKVTGALDVVSGYAGGTGANPTYDSYASKGYVEAIQVSYDPDAVSYQTLLDVFWRHIDPTDGGGQFADRGPHYRSVIFYHDEEQRQAAERSKAELEKSGRFSKQIATDIIEFTNFFAAEDYHQKYRETNPSRYARYRQASGRDGFLEKTWGSEGKSAPPPEMPYVKPDDATLRSMLTPRQYEVTQEKGTEPPFQNEYWNNKEEGIYVDIVSGEPLFSSLDKYDSRTGWPSFTRPLEKENLVEKQDREFSLIRTEVRSKRADSHLGHVFRDGPRPTGLRYCMNSAAMRFIPRDRLAEEGYGEYAKIFEK